MPNDASAAGSPGGSHTRLPTNRSPPASPRFRSNLEIRLPKLGPPSHKAITGYEHQDCFYSEDVCGQKVSNRFSRVIFHCILPLTEPISKTHGLPNLFPKLFLEACHHQVLPCSSSTPTTQAWYLVDETKSSEDFYPLGDLVGASNMDRTGNSCAIDYQHRKAYPGTSWTTTTPYEEQRNSFGDVETDPNRRQQTRSPKIWVSSAR